MPLNTKVFECVTENYGGLLQSEDSCVSPRKTDKLAESSLVDEMTGSQVGLNGPKPKEMSRRDCAVVFTIETLRSAFRYAYDAIGRVTI